MSEDCEPHELLRPVGHFPSSSQTVPIANNQVHFDHWQLTMANPAYAEAAWLDEWTPQKAKVTNTVT